MRLVWIFVVGVLYGIVELFLGGAGCLFLRHGLRTAGRQWIVLGSRGFWMERGI